MLLWLLRRRLGGIDGRRVGLAFAKVSVASVAMALVAWGVEHLLETAAPGSSLSLKLVRVAAGIGSGIGTLAVAARLLRIAEFDEALRAVSARSSHPRVREDCGTIRPATMRYPSSSPRTVVYQFGPGPITPVVKLLIWTNVVMFVLSWLVPDIIRYLGLQPDAVFSRLYIWQLGHLHVPARRHLPHPVQHAGVVDVRRGAGAAVGPGLLPEVCPVTGIGAAATTLALALAPGQLGSAIRHAVTVGASGAIYGLLLAYALYFPDKPIYMWALFPIPAKYFVMIMGAIAFMSSVGGDQGGVANSAHLGGLVVGYLYLRVWRGRPLDALRYRYVKFRMNRLRRKFDVHAGGRGGWDKRVH